MRLSRHVLPLDLRATLQGLGRIQFVLAAVFALPALIALAFAEWVPLIGFAIISIVLAGLGWLAVHHFQGSLRLREAVLVTALTYPQFALCGALVLLPYAPLIDGFFEAMSGLTTTGLTLVSTHELPNSLTFFRAYSQWIGGAGIMVLSVAVLRGLGRSAARLYTIESGPEDLIGSVRSAARVVTSVYLLVSLTGFVTYLALGMGFFQAWLLVMTTVSTGGFTSPGTTLHGADPIWVLAITLFMMIGATSLTALFQVREKGLRALWRDAQLPVQLGLVAMATLALIAIGGAGAISWRHALFHVVSASTTTGYSLSNPARWAPPSFSLALLLMAIGGASGSTAGGIKVLRLVVLWRVLRRALYQRFLPPQSYVRVHVRGLVLSESDLLSVIVAVGAYLLLTIVSTLSLSMAGFEIGQALFESVSAVGTVGLSCGLTSVSLPVWCKLLLAFDMWAGRLEVVTVLALLLPAAWRARMNGS